MASPYEHHVVEDHDVTVISGGTASALPGAIETWTLSSASWGNDTGPMFDTLDLNGVVPVQTMYAVDPAVPGEIVEILANEDGTSNVTVKRGSSPSAHSANFTLKPILPPRWYKELEDTKVRYSKTSANQYTTDTTFVNAEGLSLIPVVFDYGYEIEFVLAIKGDPAADIQTRWAVPDGSIGTKFVMGPTSASSGFIGQGQHDSRMSGHALTTAIPYQTYTSVNDNHVIERAIIIPGAGQSGNGPGDIRPGGFVSLQFAALTPGGTNSGIGVGSYVRWRSIYLTDLSV